jgi:hypothetical protein
MYSCLFLCLCLPVCVCVGCDFSPPLPSSMQAQPASEACISMVRDEVFIPSPSGGVEQIQTFMRQSDRQWEHEILELETPWRIDDDSVHSHQCVIPPKGSPPRQQQETGAAPTDRGGEKLLDPAIVPLAEGSGQKSSARACSLPAAVLKHKIRAVLAGENGGLLAKRRRFTTKCWECEHKQGASSGVSVQWCRYVLGHSGPEIRSSGPLAQQVTAAGAESGWLAAAADPSSVKVVQQSGCREDRVAVPDEAFRLPFFFTVLVCYGCFPILVQLGWFRLKLAEWLDRYIKYICSWACHSCGLLSFHFGKNILVATPLRLHSPLRSLPPPLLAICALFTAVGFDFGLQAGWHLFCFPGKSQPGKCIHDIWQAPARQQQILTLHVKQ